jgi:hypothetical protein
MNEQQYDRWRDFAFRMARTCWTNRSRPKRDWIIEAVENFFDGLEDWELIESWEHSADYPEGHQYHRATYDGPCWCVLNPPKKKSKKVCYGCNGTGRRVAWASRSLLCDDMRCWADLYIDELQFMTKRQWQRYERLRDKGDWDEADALRAEVRQLYLSPVACCVRAGFDCAVKRSMGVLGFTAGDLRRMYPEGVPDWVTNGEWETIGVKGVIPGVGFVPEPKGDWHAFDSIADEAEIWL